ncbi:MAG: lipoprotein [Rhodobacteraceae bacterium]|nr:lipoprotein [Paracoccaceae bacterium]
MRKFILAAGVLAALSGCAAVDGAVSKAEGGVDVALHASESFVCERASVRAVAKRYWQSRARAETWADFCKLSRGTGPVAPVDALDDELLN